MSLNSVIIRASSLGHLFDCPASWAAVHLEGKRTSMNARAALGRAVHTSTAIFDLSVINGDGITIDESAAAAVDAIHHPEEEILWDEDSPISAEKIAIALHQKYCVTIAPNQNYLAV